MGDSMIGDKKGLYDFLYRALPKHNLSHLQNQFNLYMLIGIFTLSAGSLMALQYFWFF